MKMTSLSTSYAFPSSGHSSSCYTSASSTRFSGYGFRNGFIASVFGTRLFPRRCSREGLKINGARYQSSSLRVVCLRESKTPAVTHRTWDNTVLKSECPVLVEFYAKWCGPCQMVHRVIDEIAGDYRGKLKCFMLDTDDHLEVAEKYDIKAVPVVLLFKDGVKQSAIVGTMPKEFYVDAIEKLLDP